MYADKVGVIGSTVAVVVVVVYRTQEKIENEDAREMTGCVNGGRGE